MKSIMPALFLFATICSANAQEPKKQVDSTKKTTDIYRLITRKRVAGNNDQKSKDSLNQPSSAAPVRNVSQHHTPPASTQKAKSSATDENQDVSFNLIGCTGNTEQQTVTLSFSFSNPKKAHQLVSLSLKSLTGRTNALDEESNEFSAGQIVLGGESNTNLYRKSVKQLPTGSILKGTVTFTNVLPSVKKFVVVNIIAETMNWTGGGDKKSGMVSLQNVPINWQN